MADKSPFQKFCEETTLHGWNWMAISKFKINYVIFWLAAIFSALVLTIISVSNLYLEFKHATVSFETETVTEPISNVYFPAIYIANKNKIRRSIIMAFLHEKGMDANLTEYEVFSAITKNFNRGVSSLTEREENIVKAAMESETLKKLFQHFVQINKVKRPSRNLYHNDSVQYLTDEEIKNLENELKDYTKIPNYLGQAISHTNLIDFLILMESPGVVFHHGGAHLWLETLRNRFQLFFEEPGDINKWKTYKKVAKSGQKYGIKFLLDAEIYDYTYLTQDASVGFYAGVIHPHDIETEQSYIEIQPGLRSVVEVKTKVIETTTKVKDRFSPVERKCFYEHEIELPHFPHDQFRYSITNCLAEAYFQAVESKCNCSTPMIPFSNTGYPKCYGKQRKCEQRHSPIGKHQTINFKGKSYTCQASCDDQSFTTSLSTTKIGSTVTPLKYGFSDKFCIILKKIINDCKGIKKYSLNDTYYSICARVEPYGLDFNCKVSDEFIEH